MFALMLAAAASPLAGTWTVDLSSEPGKPYTQPMELVLAPDGHAIGLLQHPLNPNRRGLVRATVALNSGQLDLSYLGPDDLWEG